MSKWKDVWNKRTVNSSDRLTEQLLKSTGFDTGASAITWSDWESYTNYVIDKIGASSDNDSFFEVGCGSGSFLYALHLRGFEVFGVDYSDSLVSIGNELLPEIPMCVEEAKNISIEPKADYVVSNGVFHYFPDLTYAESVLEKMLAKARKGVALLDLPDSSLQKKSEAERSKLMTPEEYKRKYLDEGLSHLYFDKNWVSSIADKLGCEVEIEQQKIPNYGNAPFRFNAFIRK